MTKEELKAKFAKELDDAELDAVAGGTFAESVDDLYRLYEINPEAANNIIKKFSTSDGEAFQDAVADAIGEIPGVDISRADSDYGNFYTYDAKDGSCYIADGSDVKKRQELWNAIYKDHGKTPVFK